MTHLAVKHLTDPWYYKDKKPNDAQIEEYTRFEDHTFHQATGFCHEIIAKTHPRESELMIGMICGENGENNLS
jgi:hypothetical protein